MERGLRSGETRRLTITAQPDDVSCGPACLHAVYRYWGTEVPLEQLLGEIDQLRSGGTLGVNLAAHALGCGYRATLYSYNLQLLDPTWFDRDVDLKEKLDAQARTKKEPRLQEATAAYLRFLELGGELRFEDLSAGLIRRHLDAGLPLIAGLSATYLYHSARERGDEVLEFDDVAGTPTGHFVVIYGYHEATGEVLVADPYTDNPLDGTPHYAVDFERLLGAVLLGVVTYDANILVLRPPEEAQEGEGS